MTWLARMSIPILTYHSIHVDGDDYASNDHIGLQSDLTLLHRLGWQVIGLDALVRALLSGDWSDLPARSVVLTLDDGSWFDWYDLAHPVYGVQRSMVNILRDFQQQHGSDAQPQLQASSFVIGSASARQALDRSCLIGLGWWGDDWWCQAHSEGLLKIANHSWDHRHAALPTELRYQPADHDGTGVEYGCFDQLSDEQEADWQIRQSQIYLHEILGTAPSPVFAYPYGQVPDWVASDYLPRYGPEMGLQAAVTTVAAMVTPDSNRWRLPRYVFRRDWHCVAQLQSLLND